MAPWVAKTARRHGIATTTQASTYKWFSTAIALAMVFDPFTCVVSLYCRTRHGTCCPVSLIIVGLSRFWTTIFFPFGKKSSKFHFHPKLQYWSQTYNFFWNWKNGAVITRDVTKPLNADQQANILDSVYAIKNSETSETYENFTPLYMEELRPCPCSRGPVGQSLAHVFWGLPDVGPLQFLDMGWWIVELDDYLLRFTLVT